LAWPVTGSKDTEVWDAIGGSCDTELFNKDTNLEGGFSIEQRAGVYRRES
jgi:hypothetical protein